MLWLGYNEIRFGDTAFTGYHGPEDQAGFTTPLGVGLRSNLLSEARSVLLYAPPLLAALLGLWSFARRHPRPTMLVLALGAAYLAGYSKWWAYEGGWCVGPRFLLPMALLLMLPLASLSRTRGIWRGLGLALATLLTLVGAALQVLTNSLEYTAMYLLHKGVFFGLGASLRALAQARWWELDYFYLGILGEVPAAWYALLLSIPLGLLAAGLYLGFLHDGMAAPRSRFSTEPHLGPGGIGTHQKKCKHGAHTTEQ